jgi:cytidylate kinase
MSAITISRELGSEGLYNATQVAQKLGYHLVDKQIIEKTFSQYGYVSFDKDYESAPSFWGRIDKDKNDMISMLNRVFRAMACYGEVVILGRGSFAALGDYIDVLNVRLQAPLAVRINRIMAERKIIDIGEAESLVLESDSVSSGFIQFWYGMRWNQADAFNLVIDTHKLPPDTAVKWIVEAHEILRHVPKDGLSTTQNIQVDQVLASAVADVLNSLAVK